MPNAIDLVTLADVKTWLSLTVTTDDALLERLITSASEFVAVYLNRDIVVTTYVDEVHSGNGTGRLMLRGYPIISVSSIKILDPRNMTSETVYNGSDVQLNRRMVFLENGRIFTKGFGNVRVSYQAGLATIPWSVQQATLELIAMRYKERDRISHVSKQLAGETVTFNIADMPNSARTLLQQVQNVVPS